VAQVWELLAGQDPCCSLSITLAFFVPSPVQNNRIVPSKKSSPMVVDDGMMTDVFDSMFLLFLVFLHSGTAESDIGR
jgi:hypothetical protein